MKRIKMSDLTENDFAHVKALIVDGQADKAHTEFEAVIARVSDITSFEVVMLRRLIFSRPVEIPILPVDERLIEYCKTLYEYWQGRSESLALTTADFRELVDAKLAYASSFGPALTRDGLKLARS